jgi:hypothetical protein
MAISSAISAIVSVFNLGNTLGRQSVKLSVTPTIGQSYPQGEHCICVEVVNLSAFPVKITDIGFNRRDGKRHSYALFGRQLFDGQRLPVRLESRDSVTAYFAAVEIHPLMATSAFAMTACGVTQKGDSAGWKDLRDYFAERAHSSA